MDEMILRIPEQYPMTDDELFAFCAANKELRIERDEYGQLIIMSPAGGITGNLNFRLTGIFAQWAEQHAHLGYGFDSATGFRLKDKSMRSPDVSWVSKEKWESLKLEEQEKFAPVCPDFVIELRSKSDSLTQLKLKMNKWISNGCELGWLIDPLDKKVYIYQPKVDTKEITGFSQKISGGNLLPGFELDLSRLQ
ncbi:MAG: Uma2 family endonuclease [Cyclobacteriaceae bacterium]|nr:Uma2 family endonuclease [Cytophagales bacterium]MBX2899569.1 Uma2 family endonuclease [Cyclobacteriaceae bacterium]